MDELVITVTGFMQQHCYPEITTPDPDITTSTKKESSNESSTTIESNPDLSTTPINSASSEGFRKSIIIFLLMVFVSMLN
jgi:hypothetical protein